jgi:DNA-binding PadR family transcriptional regulator
MPQEDLLTTVELLLMSAIVLEDNRAYGKSIYEKACELSGSGHVSYGSLYPTLERLERKGFLASTLGEPIPERGGKSRRYFSVTGAGQRVLKQNARFVSRVADRLSAAWGWS